MILTSQDVASPPALLNTLALNEKTIINKQNIDPYTIRLKIKENLIILKSRKTFTRRYFSYQKINSVKTWKGKL